MAERQAAEAPPKAPVKPSNTRIEGKRGRRFKHEPKQAEERRFRSGTVALREIRRFQNYTGFRIPKLPFQRRIKELIHDVSPGLRIQPSALLALQEVAEAMLVAGFTSLHGTDLTIKPAPFMNLPGTKSPEPPARAKSEKKSTSSTGKEKPGWKSQQTATPS
ncbi:histone H3 [Phlyctema vagabunda]|uniref:Histone H3 n=1 Tax=Phlyctema vagabunda TaxID=108571 RepID=A0ABR4P2M4_9HELO